MGSVERVVVHSKGAVRVLRDPKVGENLATHGEAMASKVNAALRATNNNLVRVHVVKAKGRNRARARVIITYPAQENVANALLGAVR